LVNGFPPNQLGAGAAYQSGTHKLYNGIVGLNVNDVLNGNQVTGTGKYTDIATVTAANLNAVSHELFHAYQDLVKNDLSGLTVSSEVQAYLFSNMVLTQFAAKVNLPGMISAVDQVYEDNTSTAFKGQFYDIVKQKNFTLANYNALINEFKQVKLGSIYTKDTVDPATDLKNVDLFSLFNTNYNTTATPAIPTVAGSATSTEWFNPKTGRFEVTGFGQNPDSPDYLFARTNDAALTKAAEKATEAVLSKNQPNSIVYGAEAAAVKAASTSEAAGGSASAIQKAAANAAKTVITNSINDSNSSSGGSSSGTTSNVTSYYGVNPADGQIAYIAYQTSGTNAGQVTATDLNSSGTTTGSTTTVVANPADSTGVTSWTLSNGTVQYTSHGEVPPSTAVGFNYSDNGLISSVAQNAKDTALAQGATPQQAAQVQLAAAEAAMNAENSGLSAESVQAAAAAATTDTLQNYGYYNDDDQFYDFDDYDDSSTSSSSNDQDGFYDTASNDDSSNDNYDDSYDDSGSGMTEEEYEEYEEYGVQSF
ncbi:MAG: hypothetical protein JWQ57_287, partial [Mucilaginibacter sp.]|nr:hypothetical protein [Mucilaginibacter sp.]